MKIRLLTGVLALYAGLAHGSSYLYKTLDGVPIDGCGTVIGTHQMNPTSTLLVRTKRAGDIVLRLAWIHGPVYGQPFYDKAKDEFSRLSGLGVCWRSWHKYTEKELGFKSFYDIYLAEAWVKTEGLWQDVGRMLLFKGLAWHYPAKDQPDRLHKDYESIASFARKMKIGIWSHSDYLIEPWKLRMKDAASR